jgi:carnitine 3-dehydrogenase
MRHFMEQFGPALTWPWSRLTDVPELSDELIERIVEQSDAQAGGRSVRELERLRDDCLVSVMQALRTHGVGAGAVLADYERALMSAAPAVSADPAEPLRLHDAAILPEWVDYNGHAHESRYLQLFGDAADALFRHVGMDAAYLARRGSYYTVETHLCHLREVGAEERVHVTTQVLGLDDKRLHAFHRLHRSADAELLATAEQMYLHVEEATGRAGPAGEPVLGALRAIAEAHAALPRPERAGRAVGGLTADRAARGAGRDR